MKQTAKCSTLKMSKSETKKIKKEVRQMFFLAPLFAAVVESAATEAFVAGATAAYALHGSHGHGSDEE